MIRSLANITWKRKAYSSLVFLLMFFCLTTAQGEEKLLFGMSTALSGPAAVLGLHMRQGVLAGIHRINRQGGLQGRSITLFSLDDGYEPSRTMVNMHTLIDENKVLAVIGNVGTPTAINAVPIANRRRTLFFAPFTGAGMLRKTPPDRYVINYRASYEEETAAMVDALVSHAHIPLNRIAFFNVSEKQ